MVREFTLPDVGEGLTEAEIVSWLVEPGDTVSEDQPVAEVETDKAVVEVPAPVDGTVRELLAEEGEMVPVGDVIITFDTDDAEGEAVQEASTEAEAAAADESSGGEAAGGEAPGNGTASAGTEAADAGEVTETEGRVFAAPSARRLARELGVDIGSVDGSGPGGRVTEDDVRVAAESGNGATPASAGADAGDGVESATRQVSEESEGGSTPSAVESADRERTLAAPATRKLAEEEGVDLDAVPTDERRDGEAFVAPEHVEQYAEAQQAAQAADAEAVSAEAGGNGTEPGDPAEDGIEAAAAAEDERIPYRGVRRTIGLATSVPPEDRVSGRADVVPDATTLSEFQ